MAAGPRSTPDWRASAWSRSSATGSASRTPSPWRSWRWCWSARSISSSSPSSASRGHRHRPLQQGRTPPHRVAVPRRGLSRLCRRGHARHPPVLQPIIASEGGEVGAPPSSCVVVPRITPRRRGGGGDC
jgi:hypothetical protein